MQPATTTSRKSPLMRVIAFAIFVLGFITLAALVFTIVTMVGAGVGALAEFGPATLVATWPTAVALAAIIFVPVFSERLARPPYAGRFLLAVWILPALAYGISSGSPWSFRAVSALLIVSATPLQPVFTLRTIMAWRSHLSRAAQIAIVTAVALIFWWLTAPVALVIGCAVAGSCP